MQYLMRLYQWLYELARAVNLLSEEVKRNGSNH